MRVAVVGAGAIGGFYGLMLARAGHELHFVVRGDYQTIREVGMQLVSPSEGDFLLAPANVYRDVAELPQCDLILVATKTTSNIDLAPQLAKVAAPGSAVVLLQNGFGVEDTFREQLAPSVNLLGGLCIVSVHRDSPGVIHHFGLGALNVGYHSGEAGQRSAVESMIETTFREAGIELSIMPDLITARWQKLVMNIPFSGLTVLLDSGTRALMVHPATRALVRQLMVEVEAAAALCGHPLPAGYIDEAWAKTDGQPDYQSSMQVDFNAGRPLELDSIYEAPLAAVAAAGGAMPKVEMLYQSLLFLNQRNLQQ
ncbi:putative 2-dehydropantoate 2-reductase [Halopseudomonas bauzanensis]|uniref:2-dehydropantoate 2-reductase n=1 Tax=Halopseudomonas bauzanensis TaxID=653930 RepID=A0A4U0YQM2_9GAMM|nr:putative 2-dehydropantoate 2-reductase [Halopseudomonas bauzanensis]TKA92204.1 putative 2-dehydropantoate 2-reductase [Halopseudomonas bauzanensis]